MSTRYWVVVPAAGAGRRMAASADAKPKQYLSLAGRTVIEWALAPFLERADIAGVMVALAPDDTRFMTLAIARDPRVRTTVGGSERAVSVLRGIQALQANADDWVLVHDAARPCLHRDDLSRLLTELTHDEVGGLLATPVADTLKSAAANRVTATPSREHLWRAFTPQMFRHSLLVRALSAAGDASDESVAIERLGLRPKLVAGRNDNIKITVPEDLPHAEFILQQRRR